VSTSAAAEFARGVGSSGGSQGSRGSGASILEAIRRRGPAAGVGMH